MRKLLSLNSYLSIWWTNNNGLEETKYTHKSKDVFLKKKKVEWKDTVTNNKVKNLALKNWFAIQEKETLH